MKAGIDHLTVTENEYRLLKENRALKDALQKAYDMLLKQEDALRGLGADEPNAESAILTARNLLTT